MSTTVETDAAAASKFGRAYACWAATGFFYGAVATSTSLALTPTWIYPLEVAVFIFATLVGIWGARIFVAEWSRGLTPDGGKRATITVAVAALVIGLLAGAILGPFLPGRGGAQAIAVTGYSWMPEDADATPLVFTGEYELDASVDNLDTDQVVWTWSSNADHSGQFYAQRQCDVNPDNSHKVSCLGFNGSPQDKTLPRGYVLIVAVMTVAQGDKLQLQKDAHKDARNKITQIPHVGDLLTFGVTRYPYPTTTSTPTP